MDKADIEKRTFLLTLDIDDGETLASHAGFVPASEDVRERERHQVTKDWAVLNAEGILPHLAKYAKWFTDVALPEHVSPHDRAMSMNASITFAGAAISRLKQLGLLETPASRRVIPFLRDGETGEIMDNSIPDELMEHAAELYAWVADEGEVEEDER